MKRLISIMFAVIMIAGAVQALTVTSAQAGGDCDNANTGVQGGGFGETLGLDDGSQTANTPSVNGCVKDKPEPKDEPTPKAPKSPPTATPTPTPPKSTPTPVPSTPKYTPAPAPEQPVVDNRKPRLSMQVRTICAEVRKTARGSIQARYGKIVISNKGDGAGVALVNGKKFVVPAGEQIVREVAPKDNGSWAAKVKLGSKKVQHVKGTCGPCTASPVVNEGAEKVAADATTTKSDSHTPAWVWLAMGLIAMGAFALGARRRKTNEVTTDAAEDTSVQPAAAE